MTLDGVPPLCRIAATHLPLPFGKVSATTAPNRPQLETSYAVQRAISDARRIDFPRQSGTDAETGKPLPPIATPECRRNPANIGE